MNKFKTKITIILDNFFNDDNPKPSLQYNRHEPYIEPNPRASKLARENIYSYDEMKTMVDRYPLYEDKDLYNCAKGLRWGISVKTLDKFYEFYKVKNGK